MKIFEKTGVIIAISVTQIYFGLAIFRVVPGYQGPQTTISTIVGALLIFLGLIKLYVKFIANKKPKSTIDLNEKDLAEIKRLIAENKEAAAIIYLREKTDLPLPEAVEFIEDLKAR